MSGPRQLYQPKAGARVTVSLVIHLLQTCKTRNDGEPCGIDDLKPVVPL